MAANISRVAICELVMPLRDRSASLTTKRRTDQVRRPRWFELVELFGSISSHGIPTQIFGPFKDTTTIVTMENCNLRKDCRKLDKEISRIIWNSKGLIFSINTQLPIIKRKKSDENR